MWNGSKLALAAAVLTGCQGLGLSCTEMGCQGSLTIWLDRDLSEDAIVELEQGARFVECSFDAEYADTCNVTMVDGQLAIVVMTSMSEPPESYVVAISEGGADPVVYDVFPDWSDDVFYPNGEACGGGCTSGEAEILLD